MEKIKRILYSPLGSTDPVRGFHDGAMLHILRCYRPDMVLWHITNEMRKYEDNNRLAVQNLKENTGYAPVILEPYYDDIDDASDFDHFYDPFYEQIKKLAEEYPDYEIIVNISSGTPQMKMPLAILCQTLDVKVIPVQVKNFQNSSGTSERITSKGYNVKAEIEMNVDNSENAENRCEVPKLFGIRRENELLKINELLSHYDYRAVAALRCVSLKPEAELDSFTDRMIRHMVLRSEYDLYNADKTAECITEFELYPANNKNGAEYDEYHQCAEYVMMLELMRKAKQYTDFVIRLNPIIVRLQKKFIETEYPDICKCINSEYELSAESLETECPELKAFLDAKYKTGLKDTYLNISICNYIIEWLGYKETEKGNFFFNIANLNFKKRNSAAHKLSNVTENDIYYLTRITPRKIIKTLISILGELYPEYYVEELFSIYDRANEAIKNSLR